MEDNKIMDRHDTIQLAIQRAVSMWKVNPDLGREVLVKLGGLYGHSMFCTDTQNIITEYMDESVDIDASVMELLCLVKYNLTLLDTTVPALHRDIIAILPEISGTSSAENADTLVPAVTIGILTPREPGECDDYMTLVRVLILHAKHALCVYTKDKLNEEP